jgi:orotidine-5'-phosphate decarboxylase
LIQRRSKAVPATRFKQTSNGHKTAIKPARDAWRRSAVYPATGASFISQPFIGQPFTRQAGHPFVLRSTDRSLVTRPPLASSSLESSFAARLARQVRATRSAVCVGLDPRWEQLPPVLQSDDSPAGRAAAYEQFCRSIIDVVAGSVPAVKPQLAFFEQLGPAGLIALRRIVAHATAQNLLVILDAKRHDIGTTAEAYADAYLGTGQQSAWGGDALTVGPYLGADTLQPFIDVCDRRAAGIFVLVKTSNPGSGFLQDRRSDGTSVYEVVADAVQRCSAERSDDRGAEGYGPVGAVVGATYPQQLADLRQRMPAAWLLVPGYGAQGGGANDCAAAFDAQGLGAIVNNSRGIIFAFRSAEYQHLGDWQLAVAEATRRMNDDLREATSVGRL